MASKTVYEGEHFIVTAHSNGDINVVPKKSSHAILIRWREVGTLITTPAKIEIIPFGHNPAILIPTVETD